MDLFGLGPAELIIILVIVLVLFGPKRLPQLGKSLGKTMKSLRDGLEGKDDDEDRDIATPTDVPTQSTPAESSGDSPPID